MQAVHALQCMLLQLWHMAIPVASSTRVPVFDCNTRVHSTMVESLDQVECSMRPLPTCTSIAIFNTYTRVLRVLQYCVNRCTRSSIVVTRTLVLYSSVRERASGQCPSCTGCSWVNEYTDVYAQCLHLVTMNGYRGWAPADTFPGFSASVLIVFTFDARLFSSRATLAEPCTESKLRSVKFCQPRVQYVSGWKTSNPQATEISWSC